MSEKEIKGWRLWVSNNKVKVTAVATTAVAGVIGVIAGDAGVLDTIVTVIKSVFGG